MAKIGYREETLEQLEDFFEFAPVGMHLLDTKGIIRRANIAEKEILGFFDAPEKYVGHRFLDFCADRALAEDALARALSGEVVNNLSLEMHNAEGQKTRVIADVNARIDNGGPIVTRWFVRPAVPAELPTARAVELSDDVTVKLACMTEREKADSFDELNDFFDNAPVGVHFVGLNGVMMRANRAEIALLGYEEEPGAYIGRHVRHIHHETAVVEGLLERLVAGIPVISQEAYLKKRDGGLEAVLIYSGLRLKDGKFQNTRCFLFGNPCPSKPPTQTHVLGFSWPRNEEEAELQV